MAIDYLCWFFIVFMLILGIAAAFVLLIAIYDFWKESDLKADLNERKRNRWRKHD